MNGVKSILAAAVALAALTGAGTVQAVNGASDAEGARAAGQATGMVVAQAASQQPATSSPTHASLAKAIQAAEERTKGVARRAELEREDGYYVYEIGTVTKDGSAKVYVDFTNGNVNRVDTRSFISKIGDVFDRDDRRRDEAQFNALSAAKVSLSQAVSAAEKETGGRAVDARVRDNYGALYYQVSVLKDRMRQRVEVDGVTAKVVAVATRQPRYRGRRDDDDDDHGRGHRRDDDDDDHGRGHDRDRHHDDHDD